jgi:hypothetical protein
VASAWVAFAAQLRGAPAGVGGGAEVGRSLGMSDRVGVSICDAATERVW